MLEVVSVAISTYISETSGIFFTISASKLLSIASGVVSFQPGVKISNDVISLGAYKSIMIYTCKRKHSYKYKYIKIKTTTGTSLLGAHFVKSDNSPQPASYHTLP